MTSPYTEGMLCCDKLLPPNGYESIVLLTHDVETSIGLENIDIVRNIEKLHCVDSTWNFVLEKYGSPQLYIEKLQKDGCECGAHGLFHDGKLFESYDVYNTRMQKVYEISERLGLCGFRAPSLHRNVEWMTSFSFRWDSSFPAWDPFQPQPGGCRNATPYKINNITWELPVTLLQDYTLFYELQQTDISVWKAQSTALSMHGQLINIIVHPDYMNARLLVCYSEFIRYCKTSLRAWFVTPSELCDYLERINE